MLKILPLKSADLKKLFELENLCIESVGFGKFCAEKELTDKLPIRLKSNIDLYTTYGFLRINGKIKNEYFHIECYDGFIRIYSDEKNLEQIEDKIKL